MGRGLFIRPQVRPTTRRHVEIGRALGAAASPRERSWRTAERHFSGAATPTGKTVAASPFIESGLAASGVGCHRKATRNPLRLIVTYVITNSLGYCVCHTNKCASVGRTDHAFRSRGREKSQRKAPQREGCE
jgi:hypothetical protein